MIIDELIKQCVRKIMKLSIGKVTKRLFVIRWLFRLLSRWLIKLVPFKVMKGRVIQFANHCINYAGDYHSAKELLDLHIDGSPPRGGGEVRQVRQPPGDLAAPKPCHDPARQGQKFLEDEKVAGPSLSSACRLLPAGADKINIHAAYVQKFFLTSFSCYLEIMFFSELRYRDRRYE